MKAKISLDKNEQLKRQQSAMNIMLEMLPPSQMRLVIMFILGITLTLAGVGIILVGVLPEKMKAFVLVIGIIVTFCGAATIVSISVSAISKARKSGRIKTQFAQSIEDFYSRFNGVTDMELNVEGGKISVSYLIGENVLHSFSQKLSRVAVVVYENMLAIDFTEDDFCCITPDDLGAENYESFRKILMERHESYQVIEKDEKGKYILLGDDKEK